MRSPGLLARTALTALHTGAGRARTAQTRTGRTMTGRTGTGRARAALAAASALALLAAGACGSGRPFASILDQATLVVGVKPDQPGLGMKVGEGRYEGFDVDVATEVARRIGVPRVRFVTVLSSNRQDFLQSGKVGMVVATYSITPVNRSKVTFAGPYYVAHQDTLIRAEDKAEIDNVRDLKGRRLCQAAGSNSWRRVREERQIAVELVPAATYGECLAKLRDGTVDAVSTDDLILAGFSARAGSALSIVNAPFTDERLGIGLRKGDLDGCEAVNRALTAMYQDGTAEKLLKKWFGGSGLALTFTVPQFEGCA
ncbi:glutamate ABC transporter substrate-binding protein [Planomonospora venezuelensis]|uniref:Glutamate transport system substrate-binding protein n=1 Tax=Planomonospora venezuelensis TaxID=1999 RepID=A0A841D955_PLAVE|nr:glutamate ABC transporter substrate-binding protein [Planomonospora venezuelensis]MBB5964665.1 glutamate transport system substrate-binding protein [Planomonospora venezuelensis]GIN03073.1 glutamate ABC transporter substrate-binding protein [Planomonospora venezuelensis]